jgi:predicted  nucleic acid-binding Zn-ribbon protein
MLKSYKSPRYKLVAFFKKSRDQWKDKYQDAKLKNKKLEHKVRTINESRQKWKDEAILLRKELKKVTATTTENSLSPELKKKS